MFRVKRRQCLRPEPEADQTIYEPLEARKRVYVAAHEEVPTEYSTPKPPWDPQQRQRHMTVIGTNFGGSRRSRVSWAVELARAAHINLVVESIDANVAEDLRHMGWECFSNMWGGPSVAWRPEHFDLVRQRWFQTPGRRGGWGVCAQVARLKWKRPSSKLVWTVACVHVHHEVARQSPFACKDALVQLEAFLKQERCDLAYGDWNGAAFHLKPSHDGAHVSVAFPPAGWRRPDNASSLSSEGATTHHTREHGRTQLHRTHA